MYGYEYSYCNSLTPSSPSHSFSLSFAGHFFPAALQAKSLVPTYHTLEHPLIHLSFRSFLPSLVSSPSLSSFSFPPLVDEPSCSDSHCSHCWRQRAGPALSSRVFLHSLPPAGVIHPDFTKRSPWRFSSRGLAITCPRNTPSPSSFLFFAIASSLDIIHQIVATADFFLKNVFVSLRATGKPALYKSLVTLCRPPRRASLSDKSESYPPPI